MNKLGKSDKNPTLTSKDIKELQLIEAYKNDFSKIFEGVEGTVLHNKGAMGQVAFDSIFGILNEVPGLNEVTALLDTFEHLGLDATRFNVDPGLEDGGIDLAKNIMSALHNKGNITDQLKNDLKAHHEQTGHKMTDEEIDSKLDELKELIKNIKPQQQAQAAAAPKAPAPAAAPKAPAPAAAPKAAAPKAAAASGGNKKKRKKSRKYKKRNSKNTRKRKYKPKKKKTKRIIRKAKKSRKRKH